MKELSELNVLICGVGGQGNLLLERIIGRCCVREGLAVRAADTFGAAQRGGSVMSHLRMGTEVSSSLIAKKRCQILVGLEPGEALKVSEEYLAPQGLCLVNTAPILPPAVKAGNAYYPPVSEIIDALKGITAYIVTVEATALAEKHAATPRAMNVVMLGVLAGLGQLPLRTTHLEEVIKETTGRLAELNLKAFRAGLEAGKKKRTDLTALPVWHQTDA
jgi:indolepyruvate ferredoxin oxidoreductase beta subunit